MEGDKFPIGLKVLVVDDSRTCLMYLKQLLVKCKYKVTVTTEPVVALEMLRENKDEFDIVISDVHMPEMDGLKLLEAIGLELDIPVIMSSGDDNPELVMKGVTHGAVDYLVKPVRIEEVKNIWQHVIRKNQSKQKSKPNSDSNGKDDGVSNENPKEATSKKRKEQNATENDVHVDEDDEDEESNTRKKPRVVWSADLHKKFVYAVDQLGLDNAFPKKILDFMNVEGLTRENVASHLQKYRLYLKKMNASSNQSIDATTTAFNIQDSSMYMNGVPLRSSYGVNCSLRTPMNAYNPGLSQVSSGLNVGNNPRLIDTSHFQHQNNIIPITGLSNVKPQTGIPSLQDYTRCMENWKNGAAAQQNILTRRNMIPPSSFNGGFSSNEISYLKSALENPFVQVPVTPDYSFAAQNVGCNIADNPMVPNIDPSNQSFGQMGADGTSSFMQNEKVQGDEADELMGLDDSYLFESAELLAGFTQNDCDTLDDLVAGLLK